jgi:hypothetical protein
MRVSADLHWQVLRRLVSGKPPMLLNDRTSTVPLNRILLTLFINT